MECDAKPEIEDGLASENAEQEEIIDEEDDLSCNDAKTSDLQSCWNILNLIQGIGVLGIPYAIALGGYIVVLDIVFVAVLTNCTSKLIIACQYDDTTNTIRLLPKYAGYSAIGQEVWKDFGSKIIEITQVVHLFGACVLYMLLVETFLEDCFFEFLGSRWMCMIASGTILLPTVFFSNMKQISWLSLASVLLTNVTFVALIVNSIIHYNNWSVSNLFWFDFQGFSVAHCIVLFSYVAHPYLPRIENSMENKENYNQVSDVSFLLATITKLLFGTMLAVRFGTHTKQAISENVENSTLRKIMSGCLALVGYSSSSMPAALITNIIQRADVTWCSRLFPFVHLDNRMSWSEKSMDVGMRVVLLCLVVFVANLLPEFSLLMAVFGSCTAILLTVIFPVIFYYRLKPDVNRILAFCTLACGIASGVAGFVNSVIRLQQTMHEERRT